MVAPMATGRLSSRANPCRKINQDVETPVVRRGRQLRPRASVDGRRVQIDGVDPVFMNLPPEEIFFRASAAGFRHLRIVDVEHDGEDRGRQLPLCGRAGLRLAGVPAQLDLCAPRPHQVAGRLKGKRVGLPEYQLTACVWARIMLEDDYGVKPSDVIWVRGGIEHAGRPEKITIKLPPGVHMEDAPEGTTISQLLERGDIDAFIAPRAPSRGREPEFGWLFADPIAAGKDYFKRTGIFPIMHITGIRRELVERIPGCRRRCSRRFGIQGQMPGGARRHRRHQGHAAVRGGSIAAGAGAHGRDFWSYGLEPNRKVLESFLRHHHAEGLSSRMVAPEELFHPSTHESFAI